MKILFLSLVFKKEDENYLLNNSRCGLQGAVNAFQMLLIEGLDEMLGTPIQLLNSLPIGSYPYQNKKLIINSDMWEHRVGSNDKSIGFINLPVLKQIIRTKRYVKEIRKWIIENGEDDLCILTYDLYTPFLKAIKVIKEQYPKIQTCSIVTDLPNEFGFDKKDKGLLKILRYYDGKKRLSLAKYIDKFVLLTEDMKYPLNIKNKPYIVVEGICDSKYIDSNMEQSKENIKTILYTGTLNKQFGISRLLDAFSQVDKKNYNLWICGDGDMKKEIIALSEIDTRIKYFGYITREEALVLQRKATVLINPRTNDGLYTKYSFPSKTLEYMASGTPMIAYKLDGIPDEYDEFIHYIHIKTNEAIKNKIIEVCEKSLKDRTEFGELARQFVLNKKNSNVQAHKVLELLKKH